MLYDSLFYGLSPRNAMIFKPFSFEEVPLFYFKRLEQQSERASETKRNSKEGVRNEREKKNEEDKRKTSLVLAFASCRSSSALPRSEDRLDLGMTWKPKWCEGNRRDWRTFEGL